MRFKLPISISNLQTDEDLVRFSSQIFDQLQQMFDGNIGFTDNCKTTLVPVVFGKANFQQAVTHALKFIPTGYIQCGASVPGIIFDGLGGKNSEFIYLQASVAGTYKVLIF